MDWSTIRLTAALLLAAFTGGHGCDVSTPIATRETAQVEEAQAPIVEDEADKTQPAQPAEREQHVPAVEQPTKSIQHSGLIRLRDPSAAESSDPPAAVSDDVNARVVNSIGMAFVSIQPGGFIMGSPKDEQDRDDREVQHRVELTHMFYIGATEVTQDQYEQVTGSNPSKFRDEGDLPVEKVSWEDAAEFCRRLSEREGKTYRLPTEAEWEYACRAGTTTPFSFGETISTEVVNYDGREVYGKGIAGVYRRATLPVGSLGSNAWGLYDMHGNVWEWCADWYSDASYGQSPKRNPTGPANGRLRVLRGGHWVSYPQYCRSAHRFGATPRHRFATIGFRVVMEP
ncbi:MAG: formylglycine-generating enzyme family protein [Phycisphaerales bacterium]|nr:formylglycine-generating enzyme family protein [Phycisphaerales bacterium]